jgi:outer membrane protein assembly factor BamA
MRPVFQHIQETNLIDRAITSISFGPNKRTWLHPILTIKGSSSIMGLRFVHRADNARIATTYRFKLAGGYSANSYFHVYSLKQWGLPWLGYQLNAFIGNSETRIYAPRENYFYSNINRAFQEENYQIENRLLVRFLEKYTWSHAFTYGFRNGTAPEFRSQDIQCNEGFFFSATDCQEARGLLGSFQDRVFTQAVSRYTVDNPNLPTSGSQTDLSASLHYTTKKHHFWDWDARFVKYFLLGTGRYEIAPQERRSIENFSINHVQRALAYKNLQEGVFNRKVIVAQIRLGHTYEISRNRAPLYALKSIGHDTPLRSVRESPFRDWAMAAASVEYRFPIVRLVEGTIFNDYGLVGPTFHKMNLANTEHAWGVGLRFSKPNIFLFRFQFGSYGLLDRSFVTLTIDQSY